MLTGAGIKLLPASLSWNVVVVTVDAFTASLKLAIIFAPVLTPVAPFAGETDVTIGGVLSTTAVVKLQLKLLANAFPARSFIPDAPPIIVAVKTVEPAKVDVGSKVIWPNDVCTDAGIRLLPASLNWKVVPVTVAGSTVSLNVAVTKVPVTTPVAPFNGDTVEISGGVISPPLERSGNIFAESFVDRPAASVTVNSISQ